MILLAILLAGCKDPQRPQSPATRPSNSITALIAASAQDAVADIASQFKQQTGIDVKISSGGSNTLAMQILNDAPADLFLSANQEWADQVREEGYARELHPLLSNDLVIVVPSGNPAGVHTPADLQSPAVRKIALAGEKTPVGRYAEQALKSFTLYENLLAANKIARGQDARVALSYVARGEADAGIVYSTDAIASNDVAIVYRFDPATHDKIVYPLVLLNAGQHNPIARKFYEYMQSTPAQEIFRKHGFTTAEATPPKAIPVPD